MDDTQVVFSEEDENRGLNFRLDMERTNSNGHGGEREEDINMSETLKKIVDRCPEPQG